MIRNQGGVVFVDLRDRYGVTQITFSGDRDLDLMNAAEAVRGEWVLKVEGKVILRPDENRNANMLTGDIEVEANALEVLSQAQTPPMPLDDRSEVGTETRLRHRYLDLRRPRVAALLAGRAKIASGIRQGLEAQGFLEIETPTLVRSTPEGARDYIVPSRVHPGSFYALPQSPQLFKQLLMVGGQDRYYQVARCYRDEDLRTDRQPEFTQVDLEASFVDEEDVYAVLESAVGPLLEEHRGAGTTPFQRMTWHEAMARFGSDKPDLRNPLELVDVSSTAAGIGFKVFSSIVEKGGIVKCLRVPGGASFSRKVIDGLEKTAKSMGAPGLAWLKMGEEKPTGPVARFIDGAGGDALLSACGAETGDLLLFGAGDPVLVHRVLAPLRDETAERLELVDRSAVSVLWVTEFPLVEWNPDEKRFDALHHPFTMPTDEDLPILFEAAEALARGETPDRERVVGMRAKAYDLVINGIEMGSGSIRIHRQDIQESVFTLLGISEEEVEARFGWFVQALRYGTPPHGGFAIGFDRFAATLLGQDSIQDVIAFPKTMTASDLMCGAPSEVAADQLMELALRSVRTSGG